jgi:hypothetical protein
MKVLPFGARGRIRPGPERTTLMTDYWTERDQTPVLDVRVIRHGAVVHHEFCEAVSQVNEVTKEWGDIEGATIEVIDMVASVQHPDAAEIEIYDDDDRPAV